ncbi:MAG: hypothetical protein QE487_06660 [Fluviicola sp.]|nr:hypothetical protein [Fluviicola sp.]
MNSKEVLEKLATYKQFEGRNVLFKGYILEIRKVIAAPAYLPEFTERYQDYVEQSENMVALGLSDDYDIYFFNNPYSNPTLFTKLDDFLAHYKGD